MVYRQKMLILKSKILMYLVVISLGLVAAGFAASVVTHNVLHEDTALSLKLAGDYTDAGDGGEQTGSRFFMAYAMDIARRLPLSSSKSSYFYASVASTYADTLEKTKSASEASRVSSRFFDAVFPAETSALHTRLHTQVDSTDKKLSSQANAILERELVRSKDIGAYDPDNPVSIAYILAKTSLAESDVLNIPPPLADNSLARAVEDAKIRFITETYPMEDELLVAFWEGASEPGNQKRAIALPEIWQNILFVEGSSATHDAAYARHQKLLAEVIADTVTAVDAVRSHRRADASSTHIKNGTQETYPSVNAAASYAAATVLSALMPGKTDVWFRHARDARNACFLARACSTNDNRVGEYLGRRIGMLFLEKHGLPSPDSPEEEANLKPKGVLTLLGELIAIDFEIAHRRAQAFFREQTQTPHFVNAVSESRIFETVGLGAAWIDFDHDGKLDLLTNQTLWRNNGDGTFTRWMDKNKEPLLLFIRSKGPSQIAFADLDNDGCYDIYVSSYGMRPDSLNDPGEPDALIHNNCDGTFTDITAMSGIHDTLHGYGVAFADYNNDGYLDIYVANWGVALSDYGLASTTYAYEPNILYRNNGNNTFTNVTAASGVDGAARCSQLASQVPDAASARVKPSYQPIWFDFNNDGFIDLFVATDSIISPLYRNNGDGTFTDVTEQAGLCAAGPASNMGVTAGDYDNDGYLDIYVTNAGGNNLWHNNGDGTFTDVAKKTHANDIGYGWGTEFLDYDNDGNLDLFVVNGTDERTLLTNAMIKNDNRDELFHNMGNGAFVPAARDEGVSGNENKRGIAVGDYDNDGFPDMYVTNLFSSEKTYNHVYKNNAHHNHWLTIKLAGTKSNRDGIGARIILTAGGKKQTRQVISGSSFLSQSSFWQTFGLGLAREATTIEIHWPDAGRSVQVLKNVSVDHVITIQEEGR